MKTFSKIALTTFLLSIIGGILLGIYKCYIGNYLSNNWIMGIIGLVGAISLIVFLSISIKSLWKVLSIFTLFTLFGCNYAKSNQQVVVSEDCGMTWKKINSGDAVPKGGLNMCYMKVVIPNYPMQGESKFIGNLKGKVRVNTHVDYDYSITDPLAFIKQAKYLGKANTNADSEEALLDSKFEGAENSIIDKRIKDVAKNIFLSEDILEMEQSELEDKLFIESNKILEQHGVKLNFITLTFDMDEQTRQAIDVATAMKIYESKGLSDLGKNVISAKAGATKVVVENKLTQPTTPTE